METPELTSRTIMIRKHDLAIKLQTIRTHPKPEILLEQYTVPADLAAEILFRACYEFGDIEGKSVLDLGAGTGRLAIGASMLGAKYVVGIELDHEALEIAAKNSKSFGLDNDWALTDIGALRGRVDTVVMNPPFGTRRPHADLEFLQAALEISKVVYSIHKSSTRRRLTAWFKERNAKAERFITTGMEIPHQYSFHKKKMSYVDIDVFRLVQD